MAKIGIANPQSPLVALGCILFALLIIGVLLSTTIPYGRMLFDPQTLHYNVILIMTSLTVGTLLPALLAYIVGNHFVKSKSKMSHHFNGILLGLLAFWIMYIFSAVVLIPTEYFASSLTVRIILVNFIPSIAVAIITSILAISHVRSHQAKRDILEYKPYSILLIGFIILLPVWSLANSILTQNVNIYSFATLIITALIGAVSYATLINSKLNVFTKLTWSAISISVAYIALFVLSPFIAGLSQYLDERPSMESMAVENYIVWILTLIVWILFWRAQAKSLSKKSQ